MKKLFKIAITCILFCVMTTDIYGTTEILSQNEFDIKKVAIFGASVFLVQILFSTYKNDVSKECLKIFKPEELKKLLKEEENLFTEIYIDKKIETIEDRGTPKNITLKKEIVIEKAKTEPYRPKRPARGHVKIVRERKNRNLELEPKEKTTVLKQYKEVKKKKTKSEGKSKTREIKNSSESRKKAKKVLGEEKNKNL